MKDNWDRRGSVRRINRPIRAKRPSTRVNVAPTKQKPPNQNRRVARRYVTDGEMIVGLRRVRRTVAEGTGQLKNVSDFGLYCVVDFPPETSIEPSDHFDIEVTTGPCKGLVVAGHIKRIVIGLDGVSSIGIEIFDIGDEDLEMLTNVIRFLDRRKRKRR